jgi:hypothetical protein
VDESESLICLGANLSQMPDFLADASRRIAAQQTTFA